MEGVMCGGQGTFYENSICKIVLDENQHQLCRGFFVAICKTCLFNKPYGFYLIQSIIIA